MIVPAVVYSLVIPSGPWAHGWGIPMATDTAFAIALIAMLGRRVPVELRIFLTAAAIVDDIVAILLVAVFYSAGQNWDWLLAGLVILVLLALLNRMHVYRAAPYLLHVGRRATHKNIPPCAGTSNTQPYSISAFCAIC